MTLDPARFARRPLADLVAALHHARPTEIPAAGHVRLYGPSMNMLATTVVGGARFPADHPDIDLPGVDLGSYLGGGGQGCVYAGTVRRTGAAVAIKVLHRVDASWAVREALLAARLRHPNILRVLRAEPAGAFWVVVAELVHGHELGPLPVEQARSCLSQLADALAVLAASRVVHRDVKPANILVRAADASPVLVDFGLAIDLDAPIDPDAGMSGTPLFLPPEAWREEAPTSAWDAYALGVTAACVLAAPSLNTAPEGGIRAAKLSGAFDRNLRAALAGVADAELRDGASGLLADDPAERLRARDRARAWLAA